MLPKKKRQIVIIKSITVVLPYIINKNAVWTSWLKTWHKNENFIFKNVIILY